MKNFFHKEIAGTVHIAPLVVFRIVLGLLMTISTARFIALGWVDDHFLKTLFQFKYYGFEWVVPLNSFGMYAVHYLMLANSIAFMIGFAYRFSAAILFLTFSYCELIDATYYLNHYYFVSLVLFIMLFVPAHRYFSVDLALRPKLFSATAPAWCLNLLLFQIGLVYFFAGIAKINSDWLIHAMPLRIWLDAKSSLPVIGPLLALDATAYAFSWIGMLYDVTIVFFLLWNRSRIWAYSGVILFHLLSGILFQIGVFPIVMIGSALLFFPARIHRKWLIFLQEKFSVKKSSGIPRPRFTFLQSRPFMWIVAVYVVWQVVFPIRYLLDSGNLFWTEIGYRFSWRVMLAEKSGSALFFVRDEASGREGVVDNREFLNAHQEKQMAFQPDMILQFAHFLHSYYQQKGLKNPSVRVMSYVTWNGRPSALLIDPDANLAQIPNTFSPSNWILPYHD